MARQAVAIYTKGTKAWFEDDNEAWISATCISDETNADRVRIVFEGDANGEEYIFEADLDNLEKPHESTLPPLRNPSSIESTDDLTNLSYLNDPSVLYAIRSRYAEHSIYTYSGIVLIAVNPFDVVDLYGPHLVQQYSCRSRADLPPHLFAIAEEAYRCMMEKQTDQTIIVSGESGAGKTVSAKYIMRYFATADDQASGQLNIKDDHEMTQVERQVLATNPIMEAFGNAKTTRNDNSSRFGKYIEIQFDHGRNIIGAKFRTYLLERSRLIFQPPTERNYHIFYQLCAGLSDNDRETLAIGDYITFKYLNAGGVGEIPGVNDAQEFDATRHALSTIGIVEGRQANIFTILAALLHLGNLEITGRNDAMLLDNDSALQNVTRLLQINPAGFSKWITRKQIITRSEKIVTKLTPVQAHLVKDSVAKYIYASLFQWLVNNINETVSCARPEEIANFIGVLDIYGFEHFEKNSFEQFCINYANEKLQQQFNQHIFKLEQEEYIHEKINWTFIDFTDNQKCIDLIEGRLGILALLDEESRLPGGTDQGFCQKLYSHFDNEAQKDCFQKPRFSNTAFIVGHYAHDVEYESQNFLDKNRDSVPDEQVALLRNSNSEFLKEVLEKSSQMHPLPEQTGNKKRLSDNAKRPTLGSIFKQSLVGLMDTISMTNVHYIRCIKPNEEKAAWKFEPNMVLSQLRACGVLETIRISCTGYPSRWTFAEFADRYYILMSSDQWNVGVKDLCTAILSKFVDDTSQYQIGLSKIFFRSGQLAYLDKLRSDHFNACATLLQKQIRRFICRQRYLRLRYLVIQLQCITRQWIAKRQLQHLREEKAAVVIQTSWRRYHARQAFLAQLRWIILLQAAIRRHQTRKVFLNERQHFAALRIQKIVRGWLVRRWYKRQMSHIIMLQACLRRRLATKQLMMLKSEARSMNHLKDVSYKLENKVVELTQVMTGLKSENKVLVDKTAQLQVELNSWKDKYQKLQEQHKALESSHKELLLAEAAWKADSVEKEALARKHESSVAKMKDQEKEIQRLKQHPSQQEESGKTKLPTIDTTTDTTAATWRMLEMQREISKLKAQLVRATAGQSLPPPSPYRPAEAFGSLREPAKGEEIEMATIGQIRSRSLSDLSATRRRQHSISEMVFRPKFFGRLFKPVFLSKLRGTSISRNSLHSKTEHSAEEIDRILREEKALQAEVIEGLIETLAIPSPTMDYPSSPKEVFFPAHLINLCAVQMWNMGYVQESWRFLFAIIQSIQKHCLSFHGEHAIIPCVFWLSNVHELLSLIVLSEHELEKEVQQHALDGQRPIGWHEFEKLIRTVKYELHCLEDNLCHSLLCELKNTLSKMIISAIIDSQSLPGFVISERGRFINKLLSVSSQPSYEVDDILKLMDKVWCAVKSYYVEETIIAQIWSELLQLIGVTAFNDLLMRKNFSSWKRAMQIQYNISRVEEWCKSHDIPGGTPQFEYLMQATKLLQLKKATVQDIDNIYDICWILTPMQIQKLVSQYHAADYETAVKPEILRTVASRVINSEKNSSSQLDTVPLGDMIQPYKVPPPRAIQPQNYLPEWVIYRIYLFRHSTLFF
ncbi:P-loop containing nucleoside triphosphate hydrolase protein [Radiomyces spectabilis]|uniref:P-loop containing nucleoside triphosphate hydrolase protein n=1 Tax=Radiomyces spectabilis TaxID=64574 RepID=UPI002220F680|nr:P-loop containing nucleoside triphosphate hydrolase protein [Radiomyces spectabilis]KAI8381580.1 P-loop containing nucleoside triphosphate hydrolase protein [Radiomyces spectabilis]